MSNDSIQFMHQLNDGGLNFLNSYLEEQCECSVLHISPSRRMIYTGSDKDRASALKEKLQDISFEGDYFFCKEDACMVYDFHVNEFRNRFLFFPLKERECVFVMEKINEIYVPMSYFLRGLYYSFGRYHSLMENDTERIFSNDREYWFSLLNTRQINQEHEISVLIVQPERDCDHKKIFRAMQNFALRYGGMDIINYLHHGKIIQIIPVKYKPLVNPETAHTGQQRYPVYLLPEQLHEDFGGEYTVAIGSKVKYRDMQDSYLQAMASLYYLEYFRKDDKIIHYYTVGPASRLLQTDLIRTEAYLEDKYSVLQKYESDHNGYLFSTLRELIRCRFDYQAVTAKLHIHLNTLYYRQDKLSGILGADLSELETKIVVYEEIFAYDFINHIKAENFNRIRN